MMSYTPTPHLSTLPPSLGKPFTIIGLLIGSIATQDRFLFPLSRKGQGTRVEGGYIKCM